MRGLVVMLATAAIGCGSSGLVSVSADAGHDAAAVDASLDVVFTDAWIPDADAGIDAPEELLDDASTRDGATTFPGPCVEGMTCSGSSYPGPPPIFTCTCRNGSWSCDKSPPNPDLCPYGDLHGGPYVLPTTDPQPNAGCPSADLVCSPPDKCGEPCSCYWGTWRCGNASSVMSEAGTQGDAGCAWRVCPDFSAPDAGSCIPGEMCLTETCISDICTCSGSGRWSCEATPWFAACTCTEQ